MWEFLFVIGVGLVAVLLAVIAEKSGRKILVASITIILCLVLGLIGIFYDLKWFLAFAIVVFVGVVIYVGGTLEELVKKKKEEKEKEKEADKDSN